VNTFTRDAGRVLARLSPVILFYLIYTFVRFLLADRGPDLGPRNALTLLRLERSLHLDWEISIQHYGLRHEWIVRVANWFYVAGFLPVLVATSILAAWRAPESFLRWRTIFSLSLFLALFGFALFPVAPPRLLGPEHGFFDTLLVFGPRYYGNSQGGSLFNAYGHMPSLVNLYAAMPSMHVAWSVVAGIFLTLSIRKPWIYPIAIAHPILMAFTVIVTANHYALDIVGGLGVLAVAVGAECWATARNPARVPLLLPPIAGAGAARLLPELEPAFSE
jgi:hypothetical protein